MPDPIKNKANIVSPLQDRHYALLGKTIASWAMLELRLAHTIGLVSQAKLRSVLFVFENMTTRAKLETAAAIVTVEAIEGFPALRNAVLPLVPEMRKLIDYRHAAAHRAWLGLTSRGRMVCVDINSKGATPSIGRLAYSEAEFEAAILGINHFAAKLKELSHDHGQVNYGDAIDFGEVDFT